MFNEFDAWMRYHASDEDKTKFGKMSRTEKQEFRTLWASQKLAVQKEKFAATRSLSQTASQKGRWLTVRKIAMEYGNDPTAAVQYAKSCVTMGPSEYKLDPRSGVPLFRFIEQTDEEVHTRNWTQQQDMEPEQAPAITDANGFFLVNTQQQQQAPPTPQQQAPPTPASLQPLTSARSEQASAQHAATAQPQHQPPSPAPKSSELATASQLMEQMQASRGQASTAQKRPADGDLKDPAQAETRPGRAATRTGKEPRVSPDADQAKQIKIAETAIAKTLERVGRIVTQSAEIQHNIDNSDAWSWLSKTPANESFKQAKAAFDEKKAMSPLIKSLLLNGGDLGRADIPNEYIGGWD